MAARDFLLINLNNSFTKVALSTDTRVGTVRKTPTRELTADVFREFISGLAYSRVVLASVVPEKTAIVRQVLGETPTLEVAAGIDLGVGIDFPKPETIGADRLANAAAAAAVFAGPSVVVDFGTAVTFDILSDGPRYIGGVIAPGLEAMTHYLYDRTALLPQIDLLEPVSAIGKSTKDAMLAGAVFGYRGLVKEILANIRRELPPLDALPIIATGGYAELIAARLPEIQSVHPTLTLDGLRIIATRNFN